MNFHIHCKKSRTYMPEMALTQAMIFDDLGFTSLAPVNTHTYTLMGITGIDSY